MPAPPATTATLSRASLAELNVSYHLPVAPAYTAQLSGRAVDIPAAPPEATNGLGF